MKIWNCKCIITEAAQRHASCSGCFWTVLCLHTATFQISIKLPTSPFDSVMLIS